MNNWLAITNLKNWQVIRDKQVYGFNERNKHRKKEIELGDLLVIYIIGKMIGGIYRVKNLSPSSKIKFKEGEYNHQIKLKELICLKEPLLIDDKYKKINIIKNISIFKHAKRWGAVLMGKNIIKITENDFRYILGILRNSV